MSLVDEIKKVAAARESFISACSGLKPSQYFFKPLPESWSIAEITEHLVWAEWAGVNSIWKAIVAERKNDPIWKSEAVHHGLPIEAIIEKTWQAKEKVPQGAEPKWFGPLEYWISAMRHAQHLLDDMAKGIQGLDPEKVIYPHPISGPLNVVQRMQFLRFHMERHQRQVEDIKLNPDFPS